MGYLLYHRDGQIIVRVMQYHPAWMDRSEAVGVWCVEGRFLTAGTVGTVACSPWGLVAGLHCSSDAKSVGKARGGLLWPIILHC